MLEIARLYVECGDWLRAEPLLIEAREEAMAWNDADSEGEASAILLQFPVDDDRDRGDALRR